VLIAATRLLLHVAARVVACFEYKASGLLMVVSLGEKLQATEHRPQDRLATNLVDQIKTARDRADHTVGRKCVEQLIQTWASAAAPSRGRKRQQRGDQGAVRDGQVGHLEPRAG
jgi:hypothetical protein